VQSVVEAATFLQSASSIPVHVVQLSG
jgi:hypothetical protein